MSKICDRNYADNLMLSVKMVNNVAMCPSCNQPAWCHNKPVEQRALFWALSDDTGVSSEAIAKHMTGTSKSRIQPPSDRADRGRCIRLLELIPEWIPRLNEMVQYDVPEREQGIVINSSGISAYENSWSKQIPLIKEEGKL
jgi:hypothetical protein